MPYDINMTRTYVKTVCIETGFTGKLFYKQLEILVCISVCKLAQSQMQLNHQAA